MGYMYLEFKEDVVSEEVYRSEFKLTQSQK
jgi:hypothetical protein